MRTLAISCFALILGFSLLGCSEQGDAPEASAETPPKGAGAAPAALLDPEVEEVQAPEVFRARFEIEGKGSFVIEVVRAWSPLGADRFYNLVRLGWFDNAPFFRVIKDFMSQFGISAWPEANLIWLNRTIADDPPSKSNKRGYVTFAMRGPDSRSTQLFINTANNARLDAMGFTPFGRVVEGMDVVDAIYRVGEMQGQPGGERGVNVQRLSVEGLPYIRANFPLVDVIRDAEIVAD